MTLPDRALSLRQPWAHFMLRLPPEHIKRIENRTWGPSSFRGQFWFHASAGMTKREFYEACEFAVNVGVPRSLLPGFEEVDRGGIVGRGSLVGYIAPDGVLMEQLGARASEHFNTHWHMPGQFGYLVSAATPVPLVKCAGMLGFWRVPASILDQLRSAA